jgi:hypothetical protein
LPGSYTARLTANGKSDTANFIVKMDPRVKITATGLDQKFHLETRLASLLSQTSKAVMQAGSIREPLQKLSEQATGATKDSVQAFQKKLTGVLGAPSGFFAPPSAEATLARANGQVTVLYGQVWQADAEPTTAQSEAVTTTEHDVSDVMKRWDAIKTADIPALNHALHDAKLPEVQIESDPHREEAATDEE